MDDQGKRLLIALIISFAFLFVYQRYMLPPAPVAVEEATEKTTPAPTEEISPAPEVGAAPLEPLEPLAAEMERTVTISTPLYQVRLTNRGAAVSSFTLLRYRQELKDLESQVEMVRVVQEGGDFPLAAEFIGAGGPLGFSQALFQVEGSDLSLAEGQSGEVVFRYRTAEGLEMAKTLTFFADTYKIDCSVALHNRSDQLLRGRTTLQWAPGLEPPEGGSKGSMFSASRYGYQGAMFHAGNGRPDKIKANKLEGPVEFEGPFAWIASEDMYFVAALMPSEETTGALARKGSDGRVEVGVFSQVQLAPGSTAFLDAAAYVGPKEMAALKAVSQSLVKTIELGIFGFIAKPLLDMLNFFYRYVGNYGLAIIILSALIKIVFIPFSTISHRSMKKMSRLQPQINALRDRYKKDRDKLNQEIMKLYQENKVNPASGCLPILVQIPVFFALYRALLGAIELRHAPFYFWIADLSAKDPFYITPIFMGATMVLQQKMTPVTGDPRQAQLMMFMPIVFTALFLSFPSGLVVYWTVNNVLTIGHQYWMNKRLKLEEAAKVEVEEPGKGKKGKRKK
ncbi:MAG: membrane protein insertase YidC [bacterium]|nr:MAG: membrane protein insertase YidC [bacterium]